MDRIAAAVFDLDGVVTFTARVHAAAWKQLFDEYLGSIPGSTPFRPFTPEDYRLYVDGRLRYNGVERFLRSRGISLPDGTPSDSPSANTICGLGNRKDLIFRSQVERMGVEVDDGAIRLIRDLRKEGVRIGVASSSKNATLVLERAGLRSLFQAQVDGVVSEQLKLRSKPHPDIFLYCLSLLAVSDPARATVFEDAVAGVQAGQAGDFGLVIGVDRGDNKADLLKHGADFVLHEFTDMSVNRLFELYALAWSAKQKRAG